MHYFSEKRIFPEGEPEGFTGLEKLWLQTNALSTTLTFLQTGAHPDDESSTALAYLARELGAEVVYCCAVRGEGGQNSIGPEKGTALGVLRSREMEQAARQIPMQLYWLNTELEGSVRDFGFSKSSVETFNHWGKSKVIEELVRVIRTVKPNVVCPTFLDVEGQHGHHRAMTQATIAAYSLAADESAFPQQIEQGLSVWKANQLLMPAWGGGGDYYDDESPPPTAHFSLPTQSYLPLWAKSCIQLGEESRQYHQTQNMGFEFPLSFGEETPFHVLESDSDSNADFAGSNRLTLELWADEFPHLQPLTEKIKQIADAYPDRSGMLTAAKSASCLLDQLTGESNPYLRAHLTNKKSQLQSLISDLSGMVVNILDLPDTVSCGETTTLKAEVLNTGNDELKNITMSLFSQNGEVLAKQSVPDLKRQQTTEVNIPFVVPLEPFNAYQQRFTGERGNSALYAEMSYSFSQTEAKQLIPLNNIIIKPSVNVCLEETSRYLNLKASNSFEVVVNIENLGSELLDAGLILDIPEQWQVKPEHHRICIEPETAKTFAYTISVAEDSPTEQYLVAAKVISGNHIWCSRFKQIDYPHIEKTGFLVEAKQTVQVVRCCVPEQKIAYLSGSTDNFLPQAASLGIDLVKVNKLDSETLDDFNVLLVGSCAFSSIKEYPSLKQWVLNGGRLISFYHRPHDNWNPPEELKPGSPSMRWRVTQADGELTILQPESALFSYPNVVTERDWKGWVKERGLYFAQNWSHHYTPLIQLRDEDGIQFDGALLFGRIGQGVHIHCALSLAYQLENVVAGAAPLFANLLAAEQLN